MRITEKQVSLGKVELTVYSIKYMCAALDRTRESILGWEKDHKFPPPIVDVGDGMRWYTSYEINAYKALAQIHNIGGRNMSTVFPRALMDAHIRIRSLLSEASQSGVLPDEIDQDLI